MSEIMSEIKPCPVCGKPAEKYMGYDNGKFGCKNQDCNYRNRPQYPDDWNNRPHEEKIKREAFENGYHYATEGDYPDLTYQQNVDQAYSEWLDKLEKGEL